MTYSPGDFILCHSPTLLGKAIRLAERLRDKGPGTQYNHAALIIDDKGTLIQAVARGLAYGHVDDYPDHLLVHVTLDDTERQKAVDFGKYWLSKGVKYNYLEDLSIGLDLLTPDFIHFKSPRAMICSEFVARAMSQTGWICPKLDVGHVRPDDLYNYFPR